MLSQARGCGTVAQEGRCREGVGPKTDPPVVAYLGWDLAGPSHDIGHNGLSVSGNSRCVHVRKKVTEAVKEGGTEE